MTLEALLRSPELAETLKGYKANSIRKAKERLEDGEGTHVDRRLIRLLEREKATDITHHGLCYCVECL